MFFFYIHKNVSHADYGSKAKEDTAYLDMYQILPTSAQRIIWKPTNHMETNESYGNQRRRGLLKVPYRELKQ